MARALEKGLQDKFKNPYGAYTASYGDSAVRSSGWNKDRDLGYTIVDTRCCHGNTNRYAVLNIHTCNKLTCGGDPWNNNNDNKVFIVRFICVLKYSCMFINYQKSI